LDATQKQTRTLGPLAAMALVAGSMLGIGIFIAPPVVAQQLDRPGAFLLLWLAGGVSALCGALSVAELGSMMPRAGGDYPYLRRAYGPGLAYAAGWLQLLAIFPGSLAAMAVGTATFQFPVVLGDAYRLPEMLGVPIGADMFWAVLIVVGLTALNHVGVVISGRFQVMLTFIPVVILMGGAALVLGGGGTSEGAWSNAGSSSFQLPGVSAIALAFLPVYFAYSGWNAAIFVGGEIQSPKRNVPRALVGGTLIVTALYLVICIGFLSVFSMDHLANTGEAGTAAASEMFGLLGVLVVTTLILLAMLGSINGTVLTGSRIAYAMAQEGHCVPAAAKLHRKYGTPVVALWLQAGWALCLIASQRFEQLVNYASAAMLITGTLTVMAVLVLRRKLPDMPRPYRTWGYPVTPLLYAGSSLFVLGMLATSLDASVFLGVGWFVAALAFHRIFIAKRVQGRSAGTSGAEGPAPAAE
jgi:APA family basic amino acid/polyamine antiporter